MTFGDADPEDGYDADDPPSVLADNLRRRVAAILDDDDVYVVVGGRLRQRLELIAADLAHLRDRIIGGA